MNWELEYALLFGLPNNKLEIFDGRARCVFPFIERGAGEEHLLAWAETVCRWKGVAPPPKPVDSGSCREVRVAGFSLELHHRPMRLGIPFHVDTYLSLYSTFWRRDLWDAQPSGREAGRENMHRHADVKYNLFALFGEVAAKHGGTHSGGVDVLLSRDTAVAPDHVYYDKPAGDWMIGGDYFGGPPDLVAEVLSPATRAIDRGPRMDLYAGAGVRELWLIDPEIEQVELYRLAGGRFDRARTLGPADRFRLDLHPDVEVDVGALFDTQWKRRGEPAEPPDDSRAPEWIVPPERRVGLEFLLLAGHPERRHEIWKGQAPCVLAFGSPAEAELRFAHFLQEICAWEQAPAPTNTAIEPDTQAATVGRFRLVRHGRHVRLHVAVEGEKYRRLLETWTRRDAWNWGE